MKKPTPTQLKIIERVAACGWDVVSKNEISSAERSSYLHVQVDHEAGDPEQGDVRKVARLTNEGAAWYKQQGKRLDKQADGSWVLSKAGIADDIADWLEGNLTRLYIEWKNEGCPGTWSAYAADAVRIKWSKR